jgi:hypothetical protein
MEESYCRIPCETAGHFAWGVSVASLGTIRTLRTVRLIVIGRPAGALATVTASTSWSAESGTTRSAVTAWATIAAWPAVAAASPLPAGRVTDEVLGEVQQFRAAQFAVAIRVETHGVFDEALRRRRTARTATRAALSVAAALSELTLAGRAGIGVRTRSVGTGTSAITAESSPSGTGAAVIRSARSGGVSPRSEVSTASASATGRPQFIGRQLAVAVLVELFERRWGVGDLLGGKHSVVVRIERLHERIGRSVRASAARRTFLAVVVVAAGRALGFAIVVPLRRTFGGLRDDDHRAQGTDHAKQEPGSNPKHGKLQEMCWAYFRAETQ